MPKGFLGKLDPEGTATRALHQPCMSSPPAGLHVWPRGVTTAVFLPSHSLHVELSVLCPPSCWCSALCRGSQADARVLLLQEETDTLSSSPLLSAGIWSFEVSPFQ